MEREENYLSKKKRNIRNDIKEHLVRTKEAYAVYTEDGEVLLSRFVVTRSYNGLNKDYLLHLLYSDLELSQSFSDNIELASYLYDNYKFIVEIDAREFLSNLDI